jgi:tetratricopeptide (TPR) repeat protein
MFANILSLSLILIPALLLGDPALGQPAPLQSEASAGVSLPKGLSRSTASHVHGDDEGMILPARIATPAGSANPVELTGMAGDMPIFSRQVYDSALKNLAKRAPMMPSVASEQQDGILHQASKAGYQLAWAAYEGGDVAALDAIFTRLSRLLNPYDDPQNVNPIWRVPLARLSAIKALVALDRNDKSGADLARKRVLDLTGDLNAYPPDYLDVVQLKVAALWNKGDGAILDQSREAACKIIDNFVNNKGSILAGAQVAECNNERARQELNAKHFDSARALLDKSDDLLETISLAENSEKARIEMDISASHNIRAMAALFKHDLKGSEEAHLSSAKLMIKALNRGAYIPHSNTELIKIYQDIWEEKFRSESSSNRNHINAEIFGGIGESVEASRSLFPKSPELGIISASANIRAALAYIKIREPEKALAAVERAVKAVRESALGNPTTKFSEDGALMCDAYSSQTFVLATLNKIDESLTAYKNLQKYCGAWLKKYPSDFYARASWIFASEKIGKHLLANGRNDEAIPALKLASDWGQKSASADLGNFFAHKAGDLEAEKLSREFFVLASNQKTVRFPIYIDFSGERSPFYFYVRQYKSDEKCSNLIFNFFTGIDCNSFTGIEDQARWVRDARGGIVPADVIAYFRNLDKQAREGQMSFPDLVTERLRLAAKPKIIATEREVKDIHDQMENTAFHRTPMRWLDGSGLALSGYDAVSFTQGTRPVAGKPGIFALWDGALWLFKSTANRDLFLGDPQRYAPQYGGFAAMDILDGEIAGSDPTFFVVVDGKLFLFDSDSDAIDWRERPAELVAAANAKWSGMYPEKVDLDSGLAEQIRKLGAVEAQSPLGIFKAACEAHRASGCQKLFGARRVACEGKGTVAVCSEALDMAEAQTDKAVMASLLGNRSWYYTLDHKADAAIADARHALEIDPDQSWIVAKLADALLVNGSSKDVKEAIGRFREIKDKPGRFGKTSMCATIHDDLRTLRASNIIADPLVLMLKKSIGCGLDFLGI